MGKFILFFRWQHRGDSGGLCVRTFDRIEQMDEWIEEQGADCWGPIIVPVLKMQGVVIE